MDNTNTSPPAIEGSASALRSAIEQSRQKVIMDGKLPTNLYITSKEWRTLIKPVMQVVSCKSILCTAKRPIWEGLVVFEVKDTGTPHIEVT